MASTSGKTTCNPDSDVHITFEDQQKINKFASYNAKLDEYKDELKEKQNQLKNLEDAADELMMLDDTEKIPYHMGEIFVSYDTEESQKLVEVAKARALNEIKDLEAKCRDLKNIMSEMKVTLYAKFGNNINLETEDD